ncbi:MAG: Carboxypeptidase T [Fimbriimonadaceae bacterium]|nr:Carboxypeptidase T [Fimbriimonadaceae bacterium]
MKCRFLSVLAGITLFVSAHAQTGWARYRILVPSADAAQRVADCRLKLFSENVQIPYTDVIVGPGELEELRGLGMAFWFIRELPDADRPYEVVPQADFRYNYLPYSDLLAQYEAWRAENPKLIKRTKIGTTWNNRDIWAYTLWNPVITAPVGGEKSASKAKRTFLLFGTIHAREWVAGSVPMYIMYEYLNRIKTQPAYKKLLNEVQLVIIPVVNPDGYVYSWTNDRYWRKNRRNNSGGSYGVDLNRNFSKGWGQNGGSSSDKWSDVYRGPSAFSEPETAAIRDYSETLPKIVGMIDAHSYGEYILYSWGYTTQAPPDKTLLHNTGTAMRNAMVASGGHAYDVGQASLLLYIASGVTVDYYYDKWKTLAYTIEHRDTGWYGFELPENQIYPTQQESFAAIDNLMNAVRNR